LESYNNLNLHPEEVVLVDDFFVVAVVFFKQSVFSEQEALVEADNIIWFFHPG